MGEQGYEFKKQFSVVDIPTSATFPTPKGPQKQQAVTFSVSLFSQVSAFQTKHFPPKNPVSQPSHLLLCMSAYLMSNIVNVLSYNAHLPTAIQLTQNLDTATQNQSSLWAFRKFR